VPLLAAAAAALLVQVPFSKSNIYKNFFCLSAAVLLCWERTYKV